MAGPRIWNNIPVDNSAHRSTQNLRDMEYFDRKTQPEIDWLNVAQKVWKWVLRIKTFLFAWSNISRTSQIWFLDVLDVM